MAGDYFIGFARYTEWVNALAELRETNFPTGIEVMGFVLQSASPLGLPGMANVKVEVRVAFMEPKSRCVFYYNVVLGRFDTMDGETFTPEETGRRERIDNNAERLYDEIRRRLEDDGSIFRQGLFAVPQNLIILNGIPPTWATFDKGVLQIEAETE